MMGEAEPYNKGFGGTTNLPFPDRYENAFTDMNFQPKKQSLATMSNLYHKKAGDKYAW